MECAGVCEVRGDRVVCLWPCGSTLPGPPFAHAKGAVSTTRRVHAYVKWGGGDCETLANSDGRASVLAEVWTCGCYFGYLPSGFLGLSGTILAESRSSKNHDRPLQLFSCAVLFFCGRIVIMGVLFEARREANISE